jgi:hypothetical protein
MKNTTFPRPADAAKFSDEELIDRAIRRYHRDAECVGTTVDQPARAACRVDGTVVMVANRYRVLARYHVRGKRLYAIYTHDDRLVYPTLDRAISAVVAADIMTGGNWFAVIMADDGYRVVEQVNGQTDYVAYVSTDPGRWSDLVATDGNLDAEVAAEIAAVRAGTSDSDRFSGRWSKA